MLAYLLIAALALVMTVQMLSMMKEYREYIQKQNTKNMLYDHQMSFISKQFDTLHTDIDGVATMCNELRQDLTEVVDHLDKVKDHLVL